MILFIVIGLVLIVYFLFLEYFSKCRFAFRNIQKKYGGKDTLPLLVPYYIEFKYLDADIYLESSSSERNLILPMNLRLVSERHVFGVDQKIKKEIADLAQIYGDFQIECDMRYLKLFAKSVDDCSAEQMVEAAIKIYDYVRTIQ